MNTSPHDDCLALKAKLERANMHIAALRAGLEPFAAMPLTQEIYSVNEDGRVKEQMGLTTIKQDDILTARALMEETAIVE